MWRHWWVAALTLATCLAWPRTAAAQLGALVSPGRLARPHAELEGIGNCAKCHEQGRKVTAQKCLACHQPIADRIARKVGVHKTVTTDCVTCHAEHAGVDGELRPFDNRAFNHNTTTTFPLDGKHVAVQCTACHTTRSYLAVKSTCASCHTDTHKGTLGNSCASCHATDVPFKTVAGRFDHSKASFKLAGAHAAVSCASCHVNQTFRGVKFAACSDCHKDPHPRSQGLCTNCHTEQSWRTRTINHTRTAFPLLGKHESVACVSCHKQPAMKVKPRADTCAACHVDVHRGTFKQDCKSCHSESGWSKAPFDHATTTFQLTGKHEGLTCLKCHTSVSPTTTAAAARVADFRGLSSACATCHADVHEAELGAACESCHSTTTFRREQYTHTRQTAFFAGQHTAVTCQSCHRPAPLSVPVRTSAPMPHGVKFKAATTACVSCHDDVHLGQEASACKTCHSIESPRFTIPAFAHDTRTSFALQGRHTTVACAECHKRETGVFPAKTGSAVRYKGVGTECRACHDDVHRGQLGDRCETCHQQVTFALPGYKHRGSQLASFFVGTHAAATCADCHKPTTALAAGRTASTVHYAIDRKCVSCHTDIHRGALGPNCATCHRP